MNHLAPRPSSLSAALTATLLGVSLLCSAPTLQAQASWTFLTPATEPAARTNAHGDADITGMLMFGGNLGANVFSNELWHFDGAAWNPLTGSGTAPTARISHAAAYDRGRGRFVIFGGWDGANVLNDTWEWNGTAWNQITTATGPSPRRWAEMVYDPTSQRCILFGGWDGTVAYDDTWAWDGAVWTQLTPATVPPARGRHGMANDEVRSRIVMFGGQPTSSVGVQLGDTWEFDGTDWSLVPTTGVPGNGGLLQPAMTFDLIRQRTVLSGGYNGSYLSNTWEYDGADWMDRGAVAGFERAGGLIAYPIGVGKTLSFGGFSGATGMRQGSAEYQTPAVAGYTIGTGGCTGAAGAPQLQAVGAPWLGDTLNVSVTGVAPTAIAFMTLGFTTGSQSLAPFGGGPNCTLTLTPADAFLILTPAGMPTWSVTIPNSPSLTGQSFFNQCIAVGTAAGPVTLAASNRGDGVIGAR